MRHATRLDGRPPPGTRLGARGLFSYDLGPANPDSGLRVQWIRPEADEAKPALLERAIRQAPNRECLAISADGSLGYCVSADDLDRFPCWAVSAPADIDAIGLEHILSDEAGWRPESPRRPDAARGREGSSAPTPHGGRSEPGPFHFDLTDGKSITILPWTTPHGAQRGRRPHRRIRILCQRRRHRERRPGRLPPRPPPAPPAGANDGSQGDPGAKMEADDIGDADVGAPVISASTAAPTLDADGARGKWAPEARKAYLAAQGFSARDVPGDGN